MVLVLQRRVLVMGPRIILRGAIPIDSNIGGSGHRPLLREARACSVSCGCFCLSGFWSVACVCATLLVFSFSWVSFPSFWSFSRWSRSRVVAEAVLPLVASGTTAPSSTTALQRGTTAVRRGQGVISGAGGVSSPPYPFARPLALFLSLQQPAPREGSGGSPSPGRSSPFPSVESIPTLSSCHGCRYCPRSLFPFV